jgi:hypothetical protein
MQMIGFGGGSCSSPSVDQSYTGENASEEIYGVRTRGQGFKPGVTKVLYSVIIKGNGVSGGSGGNLVARVGVSADLSATYLAESDSISIDYDATDKEYEITFTSGPTLTASSQYYVVVSNTDPDYGDRFAIRLHTGGTYPDGIFTSGDVTKWVTATTSGDLYFKTKMCE